MKLPPHTSLTFQLRRINRIIARRCIPPTGNITKRFHLSPHLPITCVLCLITSIAIGQSARPNILYFYVDDMGWGSIGPNGQSQRRAEGLPNVRTPNLDQLAREGVNFRRGYGCFVCSPARSSQQSGFHQGHTFADRNDPDNAKKAMRADDVLIGDVLSAAGYVTGYWGKWGYGGSKDLLNPTILNVQTLPTSHGYQHVLAELHHVRAHTFFQPTLWSAPSPTDAVGGLELVANSMTRYQNNPNYPSTPALQNHSAYPKVAYCDDSYAFAALDFVRKYGQNNHQSGQPFFALLAVQIPHAPFQEIEQLPDWDAAYRDDPHFASLSPQTRQWAAMVTRIDAHFGNILAALEDPNNDGDSSDSIADNTLVIFQSDNGGPAGRNNIELDANGGLRGTKGQIYEGGIRVPLVMRWPARIHAQSRLRAGTDCDKVVDVTDLLPTFCELAGADHPLGVDGVSIAPMLSGQGVQRSRDFVIHEASRGMSSIIRGNLKLVRSDKTPPALYDLEADPAESNDIGDAHPEVVRELESLLIGERVREPKGFATTYHQWQGNDGDVTSDADHWSDYEYSNAGITYLRDDGPPKLSWIAHIHHSGDQPSRAITDGHLQVLGLEISGDRADQTLSVGPKTKVTARNELRIGPQGIVALRDGTIESLRWAEIKHGGRLTGNGQVDAKIFNHGVVDGQFKVNGDYHQFTEATSRLPLSANGAPLTVSGSVTLNGQLAIAVPDGFEPTRGKAYPIVRGKQIVGRFSNPNNEVESSDGKRFVIGYETHSVTLTVK